MSEAISTCGDRSRSPFDPLEAVTVRQAAALLHVSRPTVEKHIKAGELPSALIGRCRRIRRRDLETLLDRRTAYDWPRHEPQPSRAVDPPMEWLDENEAMPFSGKPKRPSRGIDGRPRTA